MTKRLNNKRVEFLLASNRTEKKIIEEVCGFSVVSSS